jgi:hypothetical protein
MRAWLVVAIAACSSGNPPAHPRPEPGSGSAQTPSAEIDCAALVDHAIQLRVAEVEKANAATPLTDMDRTQVHDQVASIVAPDCHKLTREAFRCAIAAITTEAFVACDH